MKTSNWIQIEDWLASIRLVLENSPEISTRYDVLIRHVAKNAHDLGMV